MRNLTTIEIVTNEALELTGTPYKWGGNCPYTEWGTDCSGYVCHLLRTGGVIGKKDYSAQMLFDLFKTRCDVITQEVADAGDLIFWENGKGKVIHVEFILNPKMMIGASGGNSLCRTIAIAKKMKAYVKAHPIDSRPGGIILRTSGLF